MLKQEEEVHVKLTALYRAHPTILNAVVANVVGLAVALGVDLAATLEASLIGLLNSLAFILTWNQVTPVIDGEAKVISYSGDVTVLRDVIAGTTISVPFEEVD